MKNLKIAMILVAAVAFFCSCGEKTVTVTMTEAHETLTYDLSNAASLTISLTCDVTADAGIKTISVKRFIKNSADSVVKTNEYRFDNSEYEGKTSYKFEWPDTLLKADLAKDYTVVYNVTASDKKDNQGSKEWTITVTETATPISANWSEVIYLTRPSSVTSQMSAIDGTIIRESENTTFGVKMTNTQTGTAAKAEKTENCAGFVIVDTDEFANVEALAAAYEAGTVTETLMLDFDYLDKAYTVMNFISKVDNTYVLVKYSKGFVYASNHNGSQGQVFGFQYKKAETPAPAAK